MDKQRNNLLAYEYLCHIGEAKEWIEDCLQDEIDPIIKLEESMRNGIVLAKLADWFAPGIVRKIFQVPIVLALSLSLTLETLSMEILTLFCS